MLYNRVIASSQVTVFGDHLGSLLVLNMICLKTKVNIT